MAKAAEGLFLLMKKVLNFCSVCEQNRQMYLDSSVMECPVCLSKYSHDSFVDLKKSKKKERRRTILSDYVSWIHSWDCCIPGCMGSVIHAHHTIPKSRLGSDMSCVPLCHDHHIGVGGVHNVGLKTFQKKHHISFDDIVKKFNDLYESGENGPRPIIKRDSF